MSSTKPVSTAAATATANAKAKKARKPSNIDPNETPSQRFVRLAKPRVAKALDAMRRLETIGKGNGYEYTPEQAKKVVDYLKDAVEKVEAAFAPRVKAVKSDSVSL